MVAGIYTLELRLLLGIRCFVHPVGVRAQHGENGERADPRARLGNLSPHTAAAHCHRIDTGFRDGQGVGEQHRPQLGSSSVESVFTRLLQLADLAAIVLNQVTSRLLGVTEKSASMLFNKLAFLLQRTGYGKRESLAVFDELLDPLPDGGRGRIGPLALPLRRPRSQSLLIGALTLAVAFLKRPDLVIERCLPLPKIADATIELGNFFPAIFARAETSLVLLLHHWQRMEGCPVLDGLDRSAVSWVSPTPRSLDFTLLGDKIPFENHVRIQNTLSRIDPVRTHAARSQLRSSSASIARRTTLETLRSRATSCSCCAASTNAPSGTRLGWVSSSS
jgi:hypothetical protein